MKTVVNRIERNMTEFPTSVSRGTPVLEAYEFMTKIEIRHLPVLENGRVVGVVSDRGVKQGRLYAGSKISVGEVMTQNPYCVPVESEASIFLKFHDVLLACEMETRRSCRHFPKRHHERELEV